MRVVFNPDRVRELREEKGLSRQELATAAGISEATARKVEGEAPVAVQTAWKVADALDVKPSRAWATCFLSEPTGPGHIRAPAVVGTNARLGGFPYEVTVINRGRRPEGPRPLSYLRRPD